MNFGTEPNMHKRLYTVLRQGLKPDIAATACAHASLIARIKWHTRYTDYDEWLEKSFRKVTVSATDEQFEEMKKMLRPYTLVHEGDMETCLVILPIVIKLNLPLYAGQ